LVTRRFVDINELRPGMVIDQSIIQPNGQLLISRESKLDWMTIGTLRQMQFTSIYIREGTEEEDSFIPKLTPAMEETVKKNRKEDPSTVALSARVKQSVSKSITHIFDNVDSPAVMEEANRISTFLMDSITGSDAIAFNIDTLKVCDEYTFTHSVEVATIAMIIAKEMKFSQEEVAQIGMCGLLHDIGKYKVPLSILNKPSSLTPAEFEIMKKHPVFSYHLLKTSGLSQEILMGILQHHEKLNGTGYPMGARKDQICRFARILAVADVFDALVSVRPYKGAFTKRDATEMIMAMSAELDIDVIHSFLNSVILYPVDCVITLSNNEKAKVVKNTPGFPLRPVVVGLTSGNLYDLSNDPRCASLIIL